MGVKELWTILAPYSERRPIYELHGKVVAIDLAGWVCESLNVVDYFVHPRQYLKNLFFRTCYLLLAGVTPVFVLDGIAPELKYGVISKRNELQFRGAKPKNPSQKVGTNKPDKGRTKFNHVLKQCESLLESMGLKCIQAPGEAEAFCAYMNEKGLVDGIISQDSDCFAYGAIKVYRNFSVSSQGTAAVQGGAVDIYDMEKVSKSMDFGLNKILVLALLCGCDYCPEGVGGVGRDAVLKLFYKYKNDEILDRVLSWRANDDKYTSLELKVDDKSICVSCGHYGKVQNHTKNGCSLCGLPKGCDASLWKEERLSIKSELALRKKALTDPEFPSKKIIAEFTHRPESFPTLDLEWKQPNLVKFVKIISNLLQWTEIYSFQKILPLLTRWQIFHSGNFTVDGCQQKGCVFPDFIKKKRNPKGIASYEIIWKDEEKLFDGLIPDEQINGFLNENSTGIQSLWTTIEPIHLVEKTYPILVEKYLESKMKKPKKKRQAKAKVTGGRKKKNNNDSLHDLSLLLEAATEIENGLKRKKVSKAKPVKGLQLISKFMPHKGTPPPPSKIMHSIKYCSTPKTANSFISDLEDDDDENIDYSIIIKGIISNSAPLKEYDGRILKYENIKYIDSPLRRSRDDSDIIPHKKQIISNSPFKSLQTQFHGKSLEFLGTNSMIEKGNNIDDGFKNLDNSMDLDFSFLCNESNANVCKSNENVNNISYFFGDLTKDNDQFEKSLDLRRIIENDSSDSESFHE